MQNKPSETNKIRKGDKVIAMAGNERGQAGRVLKIIGEKAVVQGLNVRKRHMKQTKEGQKGGIMSMERPIHISNLRICTDDNKPVKLRVRVNDQGHRELYYKLDGKEVLYRSLKKQA